MDNGRNLRSSKPHSPLVWVAVVFLLGVIVAGVVVVLVVRRAEPIVRGRIVETLSSRFQSRVTLSGFHVSLARGLEVSGNGLNIYAETDLNIHEPGIQPLLRIQEFRFRTGLFDLFHTPMHVDAVYLKGMELNIPAKEQRNQSKSLEKQLPEIKIVVARFFSEQIRLVINTLRPGKLPLEFAISTLLLKDLGPDQPFEFDATLVNPKPVGDIHSTGKVGPWQVDSARDLPVQGEYSFSHADLGSIKGIGGFLRSSGKYQGTLGRIIVDGETDTPDFRVAISGHPVPLHTDFHAIVDGSSGDTYLEPVKAKILNSCVTARGAAVRVKDPDGHRVYLDVEIENSRIEDLLRMAVRTAPPVITGKLRLQTKFDLQPGERDISDRLKLAGKFHLADIHFTNVKIQSKVDAFSVRSQGNPQEAQSQSIPDRQSNMDGVFRMQTGTLQFSKLQFFVPGTEVDMTGKYSLDGKQFDFHGHARMEARLSQMVGGWKSILLKPVDPFLSKHGAGTEVPIKVTGTNSEPHFGLDFGHKN